MYELYRLYVVTSNVQTEYRSKTHIIFIYSMLCYGPRTYYLHDIVYADSAFTLRWIRWIIPFTPWQMHVLSFFVEAFHVGNAVLVDNVLFTLSTGSSCKHTLKHPFLFTYQILHKNFKHPVLVVSTAILPLVHTRSTQILLSLQVSSSNIYRYPVQIFIITVSLMSQIHCPVFRHPFTLFQSSHHSPWLYIFMLNEDEAK